MLLMWTRITRGRSRRASASSVPSGPESGTWPICAAVRSEIPSRASSSSRQNVPSTSTTSLVGEPAEHAVVQAREARHVREHAAGRAVAEHEPGRLDVGAGPGEVARRVAAGRERLDLERGALDREPSARARASASRRRSSRARIRSTG